MVFASLKANQQRWSPQITAKPRHFAHFVIACNPFVRQHFSATIDHLQRLLMSRFFHLVFFGNSRLVAPCFIFNPNIRQKKSSIHQREFNATCIRKEYRHLTIFLLAESSTPLTLNTCRFFSFLGKRCRIEDKDAVCLTEFFCNLFGQPVEDKFIISIGLADKFLKHLSILTVTQSWFAFGQSSWFAFGETR